MPKGNPAAIEKLEDLANENVKVVLGDAKSAAIGKTAKKMLEKNNLYEAVNKNVVATAATVNELVVYVTMKQCDAAIVWEDNIYGIDEVEIVYIDENINTIKTIPACSLNTSSKKELARKFVDFVASEEGKAIYEKHGFQSVE